MRDKGEERQEAEEEKGKGNETGKGAQRENEGEKEVEKEMAVYSEKTTEVLRVSRWEQMNVHDLVVTMDQVLRMPMKDSYLKMVYQLARLD